MVIYSGFSHETWWIFPVRYVNVYQRVPEIMKDIRPSMGDLQDPKMEVRE